MVRGWEIDTDGLLVDCLRTLSLWLAHWGLGGDRIGKKWRSLGRFRAIDSGRWSDRTITLQAISCQFPGEKNHRVSMRCCRTGYSSSDNLIFHQYLYAPARIHERPHKCGGGCKFRWMQFGVSGNTGERQPQTSRASYIEFGNRLTIPVRGSIGRELETKLV